MYNNLISETELLSIIPVYSRSIKEWKTNYDKGLKEYLTERKNLYESQGIQFDKKLQLTYENRFNERCVPWRYNDVIGFVELRLINSALQLYFYKRENKRFKLDYSFKTIIENFSNINIINQQSEILNAIETIKKKYPKFNKKYFDTEMFLVMLKYLH